MKVCFYRVFMIFITLVIIDLSFPRNAHAYLDPGTGSYLFQLLLAALLGGLFAIKLFWKKIKEFSKNLFSKD